MALVKVKTKYQVTLPNALRRQAGLNVGDVLEAKVEKGRITLTPKSLVDRAIAEGLEDIRKGRIYGPFETHEAMMTSLRRNLKKLRARKTKSPGT